MSFLNKVTAFLPIGKKEENIEYFFAVNIGIEKLTAALWGLEGNELKILDTASINYSSTDEIVTGVDKLLDQVLGLKQIEPQKILFGVPDLWLSDDDLKEEYLKILKTLVKELELSPMAYVSTSRAFIHFLEKQEGVPTTGIVVGFDKAHLKVVVIRAGKLDGAKVVKRGQIAGEDIEKALLAFTDVETLPSRILIYGHNAEDLKNELLAFSWMSKLSFLHFPKIDILDSEIEIKSVCLAGGSEINSKALYKDHPINQSADKVNILSKEPEEKIKPEKSDEAKIKQDLAGKLDELKDEGDSGPPAPENFGFVVGDVAEKNQRSRLPKPGPPATTVASRAGTGGQAKIKDQNDFVADEMSNDQIGIEQKRTTEELVIPEESSYETDDFEREIAPAVPASTLPAKHKRKINFRKFIPGNFTTLLLVFGVIGILAVILGAYLFLIKTDIKVFVEPKILEKDAQVIADPKQKAVDEEAKIIPGQIVDVEVSGSGKDQASGKRQIGDPAKGTIVIRNKTDESITISKGTAITGNNQKFTLDVSVIVASRSAEDGTWSKANGTVTAVNIGADGNISSGTDMTVSGYATDKIIAKSEGNFSGGTSKDVTVISSEDQQRLLAKLTSDLRLQAQQKLQDKLSGKKILQEALSEQIVSKSYNKNINDQANEFSLNMTVRYKGTAFDDADLKTIVSKLVNTQVPDGFKLDITDTETQADVSKLEKDGKLIFLARFKAKLIPKIDTEKIISMIKFKTPQQATEIIKGMENVLGSEISIKPNLPEPLKRIPFMSQNIKIEVGLK